MPSMWCNHTPEVRILKRSAKFSEQVQPNPYTYGDFSELLDKAERAYREELGAGSVIYLRKVYEQIAVQAADAASINRLDPAGNRKNSKLFSKKLIGVGQLFHGNFLKMGILCLKN